MKKMLCFFVVSCLCITFSFFVTVAKGKSNINDALFGKVIYVDAGHGGKDNGASFNGVLEDEINLKIAGYIIENLLDWGAYVLTSRTNDYDLSDNYDKNKKRHDLINRVNQINKANVDLFVSVHLNSYSSESVKGGQVFYQNNDKSKMLANIIQDNLNELSSSKDRKIKKGDYYILNESKQTGVLVECGFLSNDNERNLLTKDSYQKKVAKKISIGIIEYFANLVD